MSELNHFDQAGKAIMVDVTEKAVTQRQATARGTIKMEPTVLKVVMEGAAGKGDVLGTARLAGIMATKRTSELIPLCHPLALTKASVDFTIDESQSAIHAACTAKLAGKTGVEMEALTGVSVALLTIYDMCKAMGKGMEITDIYLLEKTGGKSGVYRREEKTTRYGDDG